MRYWHPHNGYHLFFFPSRHETFFHTRLSWPGINSTNLQPMLSTNPNKYPCRSQKDSCNSQKWREQKWYSLPIMLPTIDMQRPCNSTRRSAWLRHDRSSTKHIFIHLKPCYSRPIFRRMINLSFSFTIWKSQYRKHPFCPFRCHIIDSLASLSSKHDCNMIWHDLGITHDCRISSK